MKNKKLYRNEKNRMIAGVCAGFADYFGMDVNLIRVLWALISCFYGAGIVAYVIAALIVPVNNGNIIDM